LEHKKPLSLLRFSSVPELGPTGGLDQLVEAVHGPHHRASDLQSRYDAGQHRSRGHFRRTAHEKVLEYQQEKDNVRDRLDTSETPLSAGIE
jgi:hypothetical protein